MVIFVHFCCCPWSLCFVEDLVLVASVLYNMFNFFFFAVQFNENNRRIVLTRINQKTQFYTSLFHSRIYKRLFMKQYTETCNSNYIHPPLLPTKLWNLAHCTSNLDSSWKFRKWLGSATKQNTPNMPLEGKVPCQWPCLLTLTCHLHHFVIDTDWLNSLSIVFYL